MQVNGERAGQAAPGSTCNPFNIIFSLLVIAGVGLANIRITSDDSCCQPGSGSYGSGSAPYGSLASSGGSRSGGGGGPTCLEAEGIDAGVAQSISETTTVQLWWKFSASGGVWHLDVNTTVDNADNRTYTIYQGSCGSLIEKGSFGPSLGVSCNQFTLVSGDAWLLVDLQIPPPNPYEASFFVSPGACP